MKLFTFIVLAVMLVGLTAQAAEVPTSRGDKAMVFMFNGFDDLSLGGYGGDYGFGMRYYIGDGTAIRAGVEFGKFAYTDEDIDWNESNNAYGVNVVYERHLAGPCSSVSPYWGFGGAYSSYSNTDEDIAGDTWTNSGTGFAGFGVMGFEWGFTDCMTFGGEYNLGFWNWTSKTEEEVGGVSDTYNEQKGSFMGFSTASVYLSVYW